jgi:hypothetical protein
MNHLNQIRFHFYGVPCSEQVENVITSLNIEQTPTISHVIVKGQDTVTIQTGDSYAKRTRNTERVFDGSSKVTITGTIREEYINILGKSIKEITAPKIKHTLNTNERHKILNGNRKPKLLGLTTA